MVRLRRVAFVLAAVVVCLGTIGAFVASSTDRARASQRSLVSAHGYVLAQGSKNTPLCALPRVCYSPALLQQAYDFPTGKKAPTGVGQTIVIVMPYGSATIADDLATFDSTFNIPPPSSFAIVNGTSAGGVGSGDLITWGVETSASVEYAHAMAPGANIVVAVSPTDDLVDVVATEAQLLPLYPGAIVSQSFGDDENDPTAQGAFQQLHATFAAATALGGTILASAGDFGATDGQDSPVASYPASDPLVTGVGGTEGNPYPGGLLGRHGYGGEQVWNEANPMFVVATGGAPSVLFDAPAYQQGVTGYAARTVPDVSFNAAINGGIEVYFGPFGFITFGGTSAAAPQWAAIAAIADEARANARQDSIGLLNTALYALAQKHGSYRQDFHDITVGTNALGPFGDFTFPGFAAGPGYDLATGLGTPDVERLVHDLVRLARDVHPGHGPRSEHDGGGGSGAGGTSGDGGQHHVKFDR